jgi:hypothetical protein
VLGFSFSEVEKAGKEWRKKAEREWRVVQFELLVLPSVHITVAEKGKVR